MTMFGVRDVHGASRVRVAVGVGASLALAAALTGCGASDTSSSAAPSSTTPPVTTTVAAPATSFAAPAPTPDAVPLATVPVVSSASAPVLVPMPNVMCMNLQAAQDLIQENGVFFSRSSDATGKGRHQVVDSNWIVVGQTPVVGALIGEGDAVLSVVKIGEPNPC
ncbi:hypothetical protein [Prescottella agglutinans]|uniref:PASTA domain-containing protein n=1 Tax=Prescottella agglutinans TaxID=1644129 RepID=A0ABT6MBM4_9NOCA|nr:hypothetical protein [Prescottella agglutinans]MDH6281635.1 hypothetical protein [Prescottella agglutinans]